MGSSRGLKHARARAGRTEVSPTRERQTTVGGRLGCSLTLESLRQTHLTTPEEVAEAMEAAEAAEIESWWDWEHAERMGQLDPDSD